MKRMAAAVFFLVSVGVALIGCTDSTSPASVPSRSSLLVGKWRLVQSDSIWPDTGEISLSYPWDPDISVEEFTQDGKWVSKNRKAGSYVYYSGSYSLTGDSLIVKFLPDYVNDYTIHVLTQDTMVLDHEVGPFLRREYYRRITSIPWRSPTTTAPGPVAATNPLHNHSTFAFFATSGTFRVYKLGEKIEEKSVTDLRDGSLKFFMLGSKTGKVIGNQGTAPVTVTRNRDTVIFVERTPLGDNNHIFTVYDDWLPAKQGFRATYHRSVEGFSGELMRTEYSGYARPVR